jgi:hypothetical protein
VDANQYSLYRYSAKHWAIDCERCGRKITNLTADKPTGEILDHILDHDEKVHGVTP